MSQGLVQSALDLFCLFSTGGTAVQSHQERHERVGWDSFVRSAVHRGFVNRKGGTTTGKGRVGSKLASSLSAIVNHAVENVEEDIGFNYGPSPIPCKDERS